MGQKVIVSTWPQAPGGLRCNRSYLISDEKGNVLVRGKTEWAMMDVRRQTLVDVGEVYPEGLQFDRPESIAEDFERISPEVWADAGEYVVRSTDIDVGGHMNNVAYVRALMGSLSSEEIRQLNIHSLEVVFREPCYEKDRLQLQKSSHDQLTDFRLLREGRTALLARMR
jgi:acyl-ACP thioesterase